MSPTLQSGGRAKPETGEGAERDERSEGVVGGPEDGADLDCGGQGHRGCRPPAPGKRDADARITRHQLVGDGAAEDGAHVVHPRVHGAGRKTRLTIPLTQPSTCERRSDLSGTSANGTEPAARFIARTVPGAHTCRLDQSA
jgi:hypothetical protein